jgi:hypothetical protein
LKRLLDTGDRNGSTSGPTPWQIYDDDDKLYFLRGTTELLNILYELTNKALCHPWPITSD